MQVLSSYYPGLITICSYCGALLAYNLNDIYEHTIYCPQCKQPTEVLVEKKYDGIIKEENKERSNS